MEVVVRYLVYLACVIAPVVSIGKCPAISCIKFCPGGYKTDSQGCMLCDCKPQFIPKMQPQMIPQMMPQPKPQGSRPVMIVPVMCPIPHCTNTCPDGFNRDSRGCPTCDCKRLSIPCPPGVMPVKCPMSPCSVAKCPIFPKATCVESYCGGCHSAFYQGGIKVNC